MIKISMIIVIFLLGLKSSLINNNPMPVKAIENYVCISAFGLEVKTIKEGLICSGWYKKKIKTSFFSYDKIDQVKWKRLNEFIFRFNENCLDSIYSAKQVVLGGSNYEIKLSSSKDGFYRRILYLNCFNSEIDSLIFYTSDLIPERQKKYFNLFKYPLNEGDYENCNCQKNAIK